MYLSLFKKLTFFWTDPILILSGNRWTSTQVFHTLKKEKTVQTKGLTLLTRIKDNFKKNVTGKSK